MELPNLGQHCSVSTCNRLDFLPIKCDACSAIVCKDHMKYEDHNCPSSSRRKDVQVPICPLCNKAVPSKNRNESPDRTVSAHIDRDCKSDPALANRRRVYANKCSLNTCKQREAIPVQCEKCLKTYCLRHRFPDDHKCQGFENTGRTMNRAGAAAIDRMRPAANSASAVAAKLSDDDGSLALAMKLSLNPNSQEDEDYLLAKALQESEQEEAAARRNRNQGVKANS